MKPTVNTALNSINYMLCPNSMPFCYPIEENTEAYELSITNCRLELWGGEALDLNSE
jgi:hypothetical protein